jgi:creatinine amidohydrolase
MMLAVRPAHVDMAQALDFPSTSQQRAQDYPILGNGKSARLAWQMQDYNPQGAAGNAGAATADKGGALLTSAGTQLARLLAELSRLPLSTLVDKPSFPD